MKKISFVFFFSFLFLCCFAAYDNLPNSYPCPTNSYGCGGNCILTYDINSVWNCYVCDKCGAAWGPPSCPYLTDCISCSNCGSGCVTHEEYHSIKTCSSCGVSYQNCKGHFCSDSNCPNGSDCFSCAGCGLACKVHSDNPNLHEELLCYLCYDSYYRCIGHKCSDLNCPDSSDCKQCSECNKCITHDGGDHSVKQCNICYVSYHNCVGHSCIVNCPDSPDCKQCLECGSQCKTHDGKDHNTSQCNICYMSYYNCVGHSCEPNPSDDPDSPDNPDSGISNGDYEFPVSVSAFDLIKKKLFPVFDVNVSTHLPKLEKDFTICGRTFSVGYDFSSGIVYDFLMNISPIIKTIVSFLMTVLFVLAVLRMFKKG